MRHVAIVVYSVLAATGCSGNADSKSTPQEANAASAVDLTAIQSNLAAFRQPQVWSGERWKVAGMRGGYPVTASIGAWEIEVVPTENEWVVDLRGIRIGDATPVQLDLSRGVLRIGGEPFVGRALSGKSPIVQDAPFSGAVFERENGNVTGTASILFLDDGRVLVDFYKVWANGQRGEYGVLSAAEPGIPASGQ